MYVPGPCDRAAAFAVGAADRPVRPDPTERVEMDQFNPTTKTQAALSAALQAASTAGNPEIRPAHLLVALLDQNDGIAAPLLKAVGVEPQAVRSEAQSKVDALPAASGASAQPKLSRESLAAITVAQELAGELSDEYVST